MVGKLIHDPQYKTSFILVCPALVVAWWLRWSGRYNRLNQEIVHTYWMMEGN